MVIYRAGQIVRADDMYATGCTAFSFEKPRLYSIANGGPNAGPLHTERTGMFKEMVNDVRGFFHENRFVIYTIALIFLADHFFFKGQFRERIRSTMEKMLCRCEDKVQKALEEK